MTRHTILLLAGALALLGLAGCSTYRYPLAELYPDPPLWNFRAKVVSGEPAESPLGEANRIARLRERLAEFRLCPRGYTITDREVANAAIRLFESETYVYYRGRCR